MNAVDVAHRAYSRAMPALKTSRDAEYDIFARVTHRLRAAAEMSQRDFTGLVRAIHDNRRLWTALAADVASEGNGLPPMLRAQIVYLCEFTFQHSHKVLNETASPEVLVEINTAIMRGLRRETGVSP